MQHQKRSQQGPEMVCSQASRRRIRCDHARARTCRRARRVRIRTVGLPGRTSDRPAGTRQDGCRTVCG